MNNYKVIVRVFRDAGNYETKELNVEAGNKKMASLRALGEISKIKEYATLFKSIISVELCQA